MGGRRPEGTEVTVAWLLDRAEPEPNTGCWLWTLGGTRAGYGIVRFERRQQGTHRIMWQLVHGPIPDGLLVCHTCDTPPCINPDHLFLGTDQDNADDREKKGRGNRPTITPLDVAAWLGESWARKRAQTTCIRGHPFDAQNTLARKNGTRACRACNYDLQRRARVARRARKES